MTSPERKIADALREVTVASGARDRTGWPSLSR